MKVNVQMIICDDQLIDDDDDDYRLPFSQCFKKYTNTREVTQAQKTTFFSIAHKHTWTVSPKQHGEHATLTYI